MANKKKKEIRRNFREQVFARDNYSCAICGVQGDGNTLDSHHITPREDMPNGGYVKENGITLCKDKCHLLAEVVLKNKTANISHQLHPSNLYKIIGSTFQEAIKASNRL